MTETVKLNLDEMIQRFRFLGQNLAPTVYAAMLITAQKMLRDVVSQRMSNPRRGSTATNLGVDTGTARRSMIERAGMTADAVFALIGSPVDYVRTHEEGFHGTVQVPASTRQHKGQIPVSAKTGAVTKRARLTVAQKAKGSWVVRAHSRKLDVIAKHFIRDTLQGAVAPLEKRILQSLLIAAKTGQVPSPGQLGA
jgi:hypothetical protein